MDLVINAAEFSEDNRLKGFIIISIVTMILLILSIYFITQPPQFLLHAMLVVYLVAIGCLIFILTLAMYLKSKGMLFKVPLKLYDDRLLIQPVLGLRPSVIFYKDIASVEFWSGVHYKKTTSGCSVLSSKKSITSVEDFKNPETLKKMAETIRPYLEKSGLKLGTVNEEGNSIQYTFHRDVRPKRISLNF